MTTNFPDLLRDTQASNQYNHAAALERCLATVPSSRLKSNEARVTLIGQALTPYLIDEALKAMSSCFRPSALFLHPLHNGFGDSVVVAFGEKQAGEDASIAQCIEQVSNQYHIDIGLTEGTPHLNQRGLLVMDMDSTVIAIECIDEIAKLAGVGEQVSKVTEMAMRGEIAFNESLHHRVACLKGVPLNQLQQIRDSIPLMPGVQRLISTLKENGWKVAIASGGFTYFADYLKERLGLDAAVSNTLAVEGELLTGEVVGEVVNADVKAATVKALTHQWDISPHQTVAMGDGANDLVMMATSALGVACHGKPVVNQQADVALRFSGLHGLLYFLS